MGAVATYEVSQVTVRLSDPNWLLVGLLTCLALMGIWRRYDVRQHAAEILKRLEAGTMPCDGAWPDERVSVFRRWIESAMSD